MRGPACAVFLFLMSGIVQGLKYDDADVRRPHVFDRGVLLRNNPALQAQELIERRAANRAVSILSPQLNYLQASIVDDFTKAAMQTQYADIKAEIADIKTQIADIKAQIADIAYAATQHEGRRCTIG